jgi:hypothetical protein
MAAERETPEVDNHRRRTGWNVRGASPAQLQKGAGGEPLAIAVLEKAGSGRMPRAPS